jgi:hypothetical protein
MVEEHLLTNLTDKNNKKPLSLIEKNNLVIKATCLYPAIIFTGMFGSLWFSGTLIDQLFPNSRNLDINKFIPNSMIYRILIFIFFLFLFVVLIIKGYKFVSKKGMFLSLVYIFLLSGIFTHFFIYSIAWFAHG